MTALSLEVPSLVRQHGLSSQGKPQLKGLDIEEVSIRYKNYREILHKIQLEM